MKKRDDCNLVDATLEELTKLGYKQVKGTCLAGDLLCAVRQSKNLWIELDAAGISAGGINSASYLVMRKKSG